ncbi:hypothetical protein PBY51_015937 [Eleginops maclovinus]|uniref:Uncharacterized protein n=1 Tax=Eleginops maclovinus TaxID=56733 RepID=A0AAN8ALT8_ELEMC|nr:hypothetical protein PBY51_015937 [Eleginops maclovinus]
MAGRRSCVNSLWSGTERVRIGERLKATLAGVLELELLRCKHLEMVDAALGDPVSAASNAEERPAEEGSRPPESTASEAEHGSTTSRRQQVSQCVCHGALHDEIIKYECGDDGDLPTSQSLCGSVDRFYRCLVVHACAKCCAPN